MAQYTNTQIHKYTNTAYDKVPERYNMWYIFEKRIVQGYQRSYSHVPNAQIHKYKYEIHKYTNTAYDEVQERPKDIKDYIPMCRTHKYINTCKTLKIPVVHVHNTKSSSFALD